MFPELDLMGWYTTGTDTPTDSDMHLHKQIVHIRESPVMVKLDPQSSNGDRVSDTSSIITHTLHRSIFVRHWLSYIFF